MLFWVDDLEWTRIHNVDWDTYSTVHFGSMKFHSVELTEKEFELLKYLGGFESTGDRRLDVFLVLSILKHLRKRNEIL